MRKKIGQIAETLKKHKTSLLLLAVFVMLAVAIRSRDLREAETFYGVVEREPAAGNTQNRSFFFHLEEGQETAAGEFGEQELCLEISPLRLERDEAFELLDEAVAEWEESVLGENPSAEEVRQDLVLPAALGGGLVAVSYESSDYEVLDTNGTVTTGDLEPEGTLVELTARFSYDDYTRIETAAFRILPPAGGSAEWILRELEREAVRTEEDSREEAAFALPDSVGGYRVIWEQGESSVWIWFLFLGGVAVFCLEWRGRQEESSRQKKRLASLEDEYPQMVDQFAVLLESGMTIRKAWERILLRAGRSGTGKTAGSRKKKGGCVYLEEMWVTYREIREGRGEREAYERFGDRIGLMSYKRFSSILTQNLSKGTRDVRELLRKEADEALQMRKSRARRLGEEAGTKMLFPMLVMLMLILLILLMPALTSL